MTHPDKAVTKAGVMAAPDSEEIICTAKDLKDLVREVEVKQFNRIWDASAGQTSDLDQVIINVMRELNEIKREVTTPVRVNISDTAWDNSKRDRNINRLAKKAGKYLSQYQNIEPTRESQLWHSVVGTFRDLVDLLTERTPNDR